MIDKGTPEQYNDEETVRRAEAALLRALSTPHKRQSEMKIGKRKPRGARENGANSERSASGASCQADAPASQAASKP